MSRYLALDWDQNQLHVIAAKVRGTSVQVQRAVVWQEGRTPTPADAEELGKLLRERLKEAGIAPAPVLACVSRDRVIVKEIRYPAVPDAEEAAIVRFQTVKELTDAPEDVIIDYAVAGTNGNGERRAAALVVRKEVLTTYQTLCQSAGLKLTALTPRLIGVASCIRQVVGKTVVTPPPEPADGAIAVVVIGEKTAEFCILKSETFLLTRSMSASANLASDIRRNLSVHAGQQPQHPVMAVYLAGKGAGELRERLGEVIEIPVHTFDPFAGSEARELPTGNRGTFAGAMGLLSAKGAGQLPINFVSPRQPKPVKNPNTRYIRAAIIGWFVLTVGLLGLGRFVYAMKSQQAEGVEQEVSHKANELTLAKATAARLKAYDDWDTPVWPDELHELAARIGDVNALRITSLTGEPIPKTATSKFSAKMTIKGKLVDPKKGRKPADDLVERFRRDGYYSPVLKMDNDQFTLTVSVQRRGPDDYKAKLPGEKGGPPFKLPEPLAEPEPEKPKAVEKEKEKGKEPEKTVDKDGKIEKDKDGEVEKKDNGNDAEKEKEGQTPGGRKLKGKSRD